MMAMDVNRDAELRLRIAALQQRIAAMDVKLTEALRQGAELAEALRAFRAALRPTDQR